MSKTYVVRMMKEVDVLVTVEMEQDDLVLDNGEDEEAILSEANDVFIQQLSQGNVWLKDSWTTYVESIEEEESNADL